MNEILLCMLTAMRLVALVYVACSCVYAQSIDAEQSNQKEQNTVKNAVASTHQDRKLTIKSIAPIPSLPVPMDLTQADNIRLDALDVTVSLKQHQAMLMYTCALNIPKGIKGKTISIGVPFRYVTPDEQANAAAQEPVRNIPFSQAVQDIEVSTDDLKGDYSLVQGHHLQADAPSMVPIAQMNHWLAAQIPNKAGVHVVTIRFSVPYTQDIVITPESKVQVGDAQLSLLTESVMTWTGGVSRAVINVYSSEMPNQSVKLDPAADPKSITTTPKGVYIWSLLGSDSKPYTSAVTLTPGAGWQLGKDGQMVVRGEKGYLTDQYDVTASSTLEKDPYGNLCSADNLKKNAGYWAANPSENGSGAILELKLKRPARLLGLMLETGISPVTNPEKDSEARRYPNIAYSMFGRPQVLQVTLNDNYSFEATLRDDWTPQIVVPPYYKQAVNSIKLRIKSSYPGTGTPASFLGILKPIVQ